MRFLPFFSLRECVLSSFFLQLVKILAASFYTFFFLYYVSLPLLILYTQTTFIDPRFQYTHTHNNDNNAAACAV